MDHKLLELHFSQLIKSWQKSRTNVFSDSSKQEYNEELKKIFDFLKNENFSKLLDSEIELRHITLDFFFKSLEFLDDSTANLIPFEIVECLKFALQEWVDNSDQFIIVTSLNNNVESFSFDPSLVFSMSKYFEFEKTYGAKFSKKLIQINLPKYLSRDYLSNVALYHELGHFVDRTYRISDAISDDIIYKYNTGTLTPEELVSIYKYFPFMVDTSIPVFIKTTALKNHLGEYFSDLFASQYIGYTLSHYLNYITFKKVNFVLTHPSSILRFSLVEEFLNNTNEPLVKIFIDSTQKSSKKVLKKRHKIFLKDDFLNLLPVELKDFEDISSLFVLGWELWLNNLDDFKKTNDMKFDPKPSEIFLIINNLIEKSINNFVIKSAWEKTKADASV